MKKYLPKYLRKKLKFIFKNVNQYSWKIRHSNSPKVFGIGNNKTGTSSLETAMRDLGYKVGNQRQAELLHKEWAKRNFKPIIEYCKTAEFFQDFPFSKPYTFIALDQAFPKSKFILTIRDNPEQWYDSLVKFHAKLWSNNQIPPTEEDLRNAKYVYEGWAWELNTYLAITPKSKPYEKNSLIQSYIDYNNSVINYFKHRSEDLLVLNVSKKGAYKKLCEFLGEPIKREEFPWENKT